MQDASNQAIKTKSARLKFSIAGAYTLLGLCCPASYDPGLASVADATFKGVPALLLGEFIGMRFSNALPDGPIRLRCVSIRGNVECKTLRLTSFKTFAARLMKLAFGGPP